MPREAFKCSYDPKTKLYRKRIKDANGKYKPLYDRDKNALKAKVEEYKNAVKAQFVVAENLNVAEYAKRWYDLNTGELSVRRKSDFKTAINLHICPIIGDMQLKDVLPDDAREVLVHMENMSHSAQVKTVAALKRIFDSAENNKYIAKSPCKNLKAGGYKAEEKSPLSEQQANTLLAVVENTSAYLFVMIGLYTGMRREEILGLCWDCVELKGAPHICVRRALTFENCRPKVSTKLKTKAAKRDIPIPPKLTKLLSTTERKSEFVVCNTLNQPHSLTSFRNVWKIIERRKIEKGEIENCETPENKRGPKINRVIDFKISPHIMRYTYISNLILSGMNVKKVQYLAGHADIRMTLGLYTKLMANRPEDLSGEIMKIFSKKPLKKRFRAKYKAKATQNIQ
ncbi:MAG: site-specific integrase [Oscillospiraceae bacterium]|nr:site-specific integrase [Oscillospiraceae bacterium]